MAANMRDVSSSDAESEAESKYRPVQPTQRRKKQHPKFQCPADFVSCDFTPCASVRLENLNDGNTELWLIKAPLNFNPDSFSGIRVPTVGLETLQTRAGQPQVYSVLSRPGATTDAHLLTSDCQRPGDTVCAPAFSGLLNICESYGDCQGNQAPMAIPACPAPQVPEGLRQRFQPFGSRTPSGQGPKGHEQEDTPRPAKKMKLDPEESNGQKKKKKKKDKRIKVEEETMAELIAGHGLTETSQETSQDLAPKEEVVEKKKKKKKKKSKDKDRGETEQGGAGGETGLNLKEEVEVKTEPVDLAYGDAQSSRKRKKKVKKEKKELCD